MHVPNLLSPHVGVLLCATAQSGLTGAFRTSFLHGFISGVSYSSAWILKYLSGLALQLDIVQRQYIHQAGLKQSDLVKVAFSAQGTWLATVEESEEVTDPELQLKLWFYHEEMQR